MANFGCNVALSACSCTDAMSAALRTVELAPFNLLHGGRSTFATGALRFNVFYALKVTT
jgi:hypothetical protein